MKSYPETHQQGVISFENEEIVLGQHTRPLLPIRGDFGIQVAKDGRIWICVDGIAFIRFSPHADGKMRRS